MHFVKKSNLNMRNNHNNYLCKFKIVKVNKLACILPDSFKYILFVLICQPTDGTWLITCLPSRKMKDESSARSE